MLGQLIHEMAVQMDYRAALHALQMKMLRAVMVLLHILVHCPEPVLGHILHHLPLRDKLLQIPVYGGDVHICALLLQRIMDLADVHGAGAVRRRIMDMGITKGVEVSVRKVAPLGDPLEITVRGYELSIRKADAQMIEVE